MRPNKATLAAAIMGVLILIDDWLGTKYLSQITEEWIMTLLGVLTPVLVWINGGGPPPQPNANKSV